MNDKGGLAKGKSHAEGGIKATVKSTGQNIEFEGGEVIINKRNVADETLLEFEGEKKTTCEILSDLNSRNNNGVTLECDSVEGKKYKYEEGGQITTWKDKYNKKYGYPKNESHSLEEISKDTGVSMKGLKQIYEKGEGAYYTNPSSVRPNVKSPQQWAMARVYSSVMGGKASNIDAKELKMAEGGIVLDKFEMFDIEDDLIENITSSDLYHGSNNVSWFKTVDDIDTFKNTVNAKSKYLFLSPNKETALNYSIDSIGMNNVIKENSGVLSFDLKKSKGKNLTKKELNYKSIEEFEDILNKYKEKGFDYVVIVPDGKNHVILNNNILDFKGKFLTSEYLSRKKQFKQGGEVDEIDYDSYKKNKEIEFYAQHGIKIPEILTLENTLDIDRANMPQIREHYMDAFLNQLSNDDIDYFYDVVSPKELKPTQAHINLDKVSTLTPEYVDSRYLVISNDNYLLDGHHRWYNSLQNNRDTKVLKIDLPIMELIDYANSFDETEYSDVYAEAKFDEGGEVSGANKMKLYFEVKNKIVPQQQVDFINQEADKMEQVGMLSNVIKAYRDIPTIAGQELKGKNAIVYLHYFNPNSDYYITEYNKKNGDMFGYYVINGNWDESKFGYIDLDFLKKNDLSILLKPELDFYWKYKTVNQILSSNAPHLVEGNVEIYQEQKTVKSTDTKWQELIENNKFKNPFEKVQAIEKMVDEKGENPDNYSVIEKKFISEYTGIGGLEKFGATTRFEGDTGLLYEYFTPQNLCEFMWGLAYKHIGTNSINNVLEPSFGAGAFLSVAPVNVIIDGYDISQYQYKICKVLFPDKRFRLKLGSFEELFIKNNFTVKGNVDPYYDLVIGNPPYGAFSGKYASKRMGEKKYTKASNYVEYFITRGLDVLKPNGLLIYVIGSVPVFGGKPFLESNITNAKSEIMKKSELVDAYRLGNSMFEQTQVDADIIVLRKK